MQFRRQVQEQVAAMEERQIRERKDRRSQRFLRTRNETRSVVIPLPFVSALFAGLSLSLGFRDSVVQRVDTLKNQQEFCSSQ